MEEVSNFIRDFINQEYEGLLLERTEKDPAVYMNAVTSISSYCDTGLGLLFIGRRPYKPNEDWYQSLDQAKQEIQPRNLYKIERYEHPELHTLYKCYCSDTKAGENTLFTILYVSGTAKRMAIVSRYNIDFKGGWVHRGGKIIAGPDTPVEKRIFQEPDWPKHVEMYKKEFA